MLNQGAGVIPEPVKAQFEDLTVVEVGPLRIQRDGAPKPLPFTPDLLIDEDTLIVNDKVRVEWDQGRAIVHGRYTLINGETNPELS